MDKIKIEKTIFVRDKYHVKRQAFVAGEEVDPRTYYATLASNAVINSEDLPKVAIPKDKLKQSLSVNAVTKPAEKKVLETKVLDPEEVKRDTLPANVEKEVKEVEEASAVPAAGEGVEPENEVVPEPAPEQDQPKRGRKKKDE